MGNVVFAKAHIFHTAETGTGNGTAMDVGGLAAVGVQIEGVVAETITFEGTIDGSTWYAVQVVNLNSGAVGTTATADGLYLAPMAGIDQFRCRISTADGGSVTATGKGVVNAAGMSLADIDIQAAEAFTLADGANIALGTTTDAPASPTVAETAAAKTSISLWKGIKNILILLNAKFAALGQAAMAASMPVAIANNQSAVPVSGTFTQARNLLVLPRCPPRPSQAHSGRRHSLSAAMLGWPPLLVRLRTFMRQQRLLLPS